MKINIIFHSLYGHVYRLAEEIAKGARQVDGADVNLFQVPETLPDEVLAKMNAIESKKSFAHIATAIPDNLAASDAVIFGTPTRFGMMSAQMKSFIDMTGGLWISKALVGKVASVFASTATQHGGQESTILSFHTTLLAHGMIIVGVPYLTDGLNVTKEVSGGTPFGATTISDIDGSRMPSENELSIARFQGEHVAKITKRLAV